jgi:ATP-binding cassette subfamily F protein 3
MLQVLNISKNFGAEPVLRDISFNLNAGERVGLVGPNGCGKSTLLRIIVGELPADLGQIQLDRTIQTPGYLAQALPFDPQATLAQTLDQTLGTHRQAWAEMQRLAMQMAQTVDSAALARYTAAYAQAEARFEASGGYEFEIQLAEILTRLGLSEIPPEMPTAYLSGGQKTRLTLASLMVRRPRLLLLDEPTNHLDREAMLWLEEWLLHYDGAVLVASHDRAMLDAVTTRTLALDPATHTIQDVPGNYSDFLAVKERGLEAQRQAYRTQQAEISQLRRAARQLRRQAHFRRGGKADNDGDKFAKGFFSNRSAGTMGRAKQIERRLTYLQNEGQAKKPAQQWGLRPNFADGDYGARRVLLLENIGLAFDDRWLLRDIHATLTYGERIALVGPNGSGKTTLLRIIIGKLQPTTGHRRVGVGVKVGYMAQNQDTLDPRLTAFLTLKSAGGLQDETEIRRLLHRFLFSADEVFIPIGQLSYGERARLMLAQLVAQGCNLLVLDEPVNHMDISSREQFETSLLEFNGSVLTAVHDRAFIERVATGVWEIVEGAIRINR